jgi:hypothetical protein
MRYSMSVKIISVYYQVNHVYNFFLSKVYNLGWENPRYFIMHPRVRDAAFIEFFDVHCIKYESIARIYPMALLNCYA